LSASRAAERSGERLDAATPVPPAVWAAVVLTVFWLAAALGCLRQWGSRDPWARLDLYSGGFLVLGAIAGMVQASTFFRSAVRSRAVAAEALGLNYDPGVLLVVALTEPGKIAVLLDYAHWHLVPALEQPVLQHLGLTLGVAGTGLLVWTDRWLARHFATDAATATLMTRGPYRLIRHPRYASFVLLGLAYPLVFASILGWPLWLLLLAAIAHRIRREEAHMRELFGTAYDRYTRETARLVSGVY
jgi:protein-S-isoprenylcysteine O-methyltransferase Ste14